VLATIGLAAAVGWCERSFGWQSPVFAALANWCVVVYVAVTSTMVRWTLPSRCHRLFRWEMDGTVYRRLGVGWFGALVRRTPLRQFSPTLYVRSRRDRLSAVLRGTEQAEDAHWWACALALPLPMFTGAHAWWAASAWLCVFNVTFNVYPALLQRFTRARLLAVLSAA
jgi:hypothetical protein